MQAITQRLSALIDEHGWEEAFQSAIDAACAHQVQSIAHIRTTADYLDYVDDSARWSPRESGDSRQVHDKMVEFFFFLDQPPLRQLQAPALPGDSATALTPLAQWIVDYVRCWGDFLDTPESAVHVDSFRTNPAFHWDDYQAPPSGYRTFNQFFARQVRPGARPVAAIGDATVLVSPADAVFIGSWRVSSRSTLYVEEPTVDAKGLQWSIGQLLAESDYADRFAGGTFMHSALRTYDYHRFHAPLPGTVVESRLVRGQAWLDVAAATVMIDGRPTRTLQALEGTGYQFSQMRAIVILDTPMGLVACVPVGMGHVSSVVITAQRGAVLHKGEELGYFQFGGSDFVMVFERRCNVELTCREGVHFLQGSAIGRLHP